MMISFLPTINTVVGIFMPKTEVIIWKYVQDRNGSYFYTIKLYS